MQQAFRYYLHSSDRRDMQRSANKVVAGYANRRHHGYPKMQRSFLFPSQGMGSSVLSKPAARSRDCGRVFQSAL
jgi:hypothetical protein